MLSADLLQRLLGAIETDSLILLCGAGLSVASPSDLPSAAKVAQLCYDKWLPTEPGLDPALRWDVDKLAGHFHAKGQFERFFIPLVPWNELVGLPNSGHAAVADLLISRAARAALSANFDSLIERWAEDHKIAMVGALSGQEAQQVGNANPLLKFHGCMHRARAHTLWTHGQLTETATTARVKSCSDWMSLVLPGSHLLVVGFWTDWGYLNDVLANAFQVSNASSVTLIDPDSSANLEAKAPALWAKLHALSAVFEHVQASGADVLDEVRTAYSKVWTRKLFDLGMPLATADGLDTVKLRPLLAPDSMSGPDLYNLRRDAEGVPYTRASAQKGPPASAAEMSYMHTLLMDAGAVRKGPWLQLKGKSIRVVNGAGRGLSDVKGEYREPTTTPSADVVICAGAVDLGVPSRVVASGAGASIVRPAVGGAAEWMTRERAITEFGL